MSGGYVGKILRLDLTNKKAHVFDTSKYEAYGGGIGLGTAIFWDLCADKLPFDAYDIQNIVTIMTSPLSGTLTPGAGRCEVNGLGPQSYPTHWFTRSNFGGRFAGQLKAAGWDGIVIEGKSDGPTWVNIVNEEVTFRDASGLWGKDTFTTQQQIWGTVTSGLKTEGWYQLGSATHSGRTTQKPAVLCIGPLGEVKAGELGVLIHDAAAAAAQGGFGAVWGSKNLKAISVLGSGSIPVADPKALLEAWEWLGARRPAYKEPIGDKVGSVGIFGPVADGINSGPVACLGCPKACHGVRNTRGTESEQFCINKGPVGEIQNKMGANTYPMMRFLPYLKTLYRQGILGPGKAINSNLPFDVPARQDPGTVQQLLDSIVKDEDIGPDLREGIIRACIKWGREKDWKTGILPFPYWGWPEHCYDVRAEVEWGYGSILGDRDINEHMIAWRFYLPFILGGSTPPTHNISAEEAATIFAEKMIPYQGDMLMLDYSTENIYSEHMAKLVAWHRHYTSFYQEGLLLCDFMWPDIVNPYAPSNRGYTVEGEPKFFHAVTGKKLTFAEGMEVGRRIWNLRNALWTLQGRHRDMVYYADYIYNSPTAGWQAFGPVYLLPTYREGKWAYTDVAGRAIDRTKFDEFKTRFYTLEGWDAKSGWPTRETLEGLNLKHVADALEAKGRLGNP